MKSAVKNIADNTVTNKNQLGIYCNQVDAATSLGLSRPSVRLYFRLNEDRG
jgi:hypothetical protein